MIRHYPEIPKEDVARQGKSYLFCDAEDCDASVEVKDVLTHEMIRGTVKEARAPKGWVTSDPEGNALNGAAHFCADHAERVPEPVGSTPPPVVETV